MRQLDVPGVVLQDERARALEHAGAAAGEARRVAPRGDALAARFNADQSHARIVDEAVEDADGVAASADAGDDDVRQPPHPFENLLPCLAADHRLELTDHQRVWMRAERRAEQVIRVVDVRDPVAHGFVDRVLEGPAAGIDGAHRRAEQLHADDVERLAAHVLRSHVNVAFEPEQRARRRSRHAVLPGAGFRHDAGLAHAPGEQRLAQRVVDLVRTGVRQVLAFEEDSHRRVGGVRAPSPRCAAGESLRLIEGRGTADVVFEQVVELRTERGVRAGRHVSRRQLLDRRHQRFGDEAAAVGAVITPRVGIPPAEHRTFCRNHVVHRLSNASRALARNCATFVKSLTPGDSSTPDDTSTPYGRTVAIASPTVAGVSPPASTTRRSRANEAARGQSTVTPVPPRRSGSAASSSSVASGAHAEQASGAVSSVTARKIGHASAFAYAGGSSPCSCTALKRAWAATLRMPSTGSLTNTPTAITSDGSSAMISAARAGAT